MSNDKIPQSVIRQSANEALVSLVLPLFHEVMNNIAYTIADDISPYGTIA
ncbi:MAG: hypothetical protein Pars93KO_26640 [Parasphingorhabdus sp.]